MDNIRDDLKYIANQHFLYHKRLVVVLCTLFSIVAFLMEVIFYIQVGPMGYYSGPK